MSDTQYLELKGELPEVFSEEMEGVLILNGAPCVQTVTRELPPPGCTDLPEEGTARLIVSLGGDEQALAATLQDAWRGFLADAGLDPAAHPFAAAWIADQDWATAWQRDFHAQKIGETLWVAPSWEPVAPKEGEVLLAIDPGMAFGSGTHETTTLCLLALEELVARQKIARLLDVGTGSGILAIAAALWGAEVALGLDNDPEALRVAGENARANGFDEDRLRFALTPVGELTESYPLVVANILSGILIELAPAIAARVAPKGRLVLSGILLEQGEEVRFAYEALGFRQERREQRGQWLALWFVRNA